MIKRFISILLCCSVFCVACAQNIPSEVPTVKELEIQTVSVNVSDNNVSENSVMQSSIEEEVRDYAVSIDSTNYEWDDNYDYDDYEKIIYEADPSYQPTSLSFEKVTPEFNSLNDEELLTYVEDNLYYEIVNSIDNDKYYVENVEAIYISKEYIEELAYNSKANIYFGYTLEELNAQFQGERYVFTLGDDGLTTVVPFEEYDDTYEQVLRNVAIGTGVILICVTVSVVSAGAGAPAVSMIFAASAKSATVFAVSSGALSSVATAIVTGVQTNDFDETLKAAALAGSKDFMWGAIGGSIMGGTMEAMTLRGMTLSGLSMNEAALIQKESGYPAEIIAQMKSMEEYEIYKDAGLKTAVIDGKLSLVRDINLEFKTQLADGSIVTNLERMQMGLAPIDPSTGLAYQLHHINQGANNTLAILTQAEHQGNAAILNTAGKASEIDRELFKVIRSDYWKSFAAAVGGT